MYIVSYISKAQKGISKLLRKAVQEAKEGSTNIKQQAGDIGNKFLNFDRNQCTRSSIGVCSSSTACAKGVTQCRRLHQYISTWRTSRAAKTFK